MVVIHDIPRSSWLVSHIYTTTADSDSDEDFHVATVADAVARNALEGRDQVYRGAKARTVRYREFSESGEND
jgi:hypothetical protein